MEAVQSMNSDVMLQLASALDDGQVTVRATARTLQTELGVPTSRLVPVRRSWLLARAPRIFRQLSG